MKMWEYKSFCIDFNCALSEWTLLTDTFSHFNELYRCLTCNPL